MKLIAKELNIPVICLAQLNRDVDKRSGSNHKPQLSDLRGSAAIEHDADTVMFIHRPEMYGQEFDEEGNSMKDYGEIIVAKHRSGETGLCKFVHNGSMTDFFKYNVDIDNNNQKDNTEIDFNQECSF